MNHEELIDYINYLGNEYLSYLSSITTISGLDYEYISNKLHEAEAEYL
jgi:hypothetical protein